MTRKRTRESLGQLLTSQCPQCHGSGHVRSTEALAYDALRRVQREAAGQEDAARITLRVHPDVAAFLGEHSARTVDALAGLLHRPITVAPDGTFAREQVEVELAV